MSLPSSPSALPNVMIMNSSMNGSAWSWPTPTRQLGDHLVGTGQPVYVTGEIGINHNGDLANALALVDAAADHVALGRLSQELSAVDTEIASVEEQWLELATEAESG